MKQKSIPPLPLHPRLKGCIFTSLAFIYYDLLGKIIWLNLCFDEVERIYRDCPIKSFCLSTASKYKQKLHLVSFYKTMALFF